MTPALPWWSGTVIYQLIVRSYSDGNGDGTGDFKGLAARLPYLRWLGVNTLWLTPIYPSPLRDGGYDITDFTGIHPDLGDLSSFHRFLTAAHSQGMRVILDLVLNHTSDLHPWFQRARWAPKGSPERDVYVWSDDPKRYAEAPVLFRHFEASNWEWDPVAEQYYLHRFLRHQPDLNYENPWVQDTMLEVVDFWLDRGVDGFRLDAVPFLLSQRGPAARGCRKPMPSSSDCGSGWMPMAVMCSCWERRFSRWRRPLPIWRLTNCMERSTSCSPPICLPPLPVAAPSSSGSA